MAKKLLNNYLDLAGTWHAGQSELLKSSKAVQINGNLRIHESSVSGVATLSGDKEMSSYGSAEVYLKIIYGGGNFEYLSAPLRTPIDFAKVRELELNILYVVGNQACNAVNYRALFNAHCIYEII